MKIKDTAEPSNRPLDVLKHWAGQLAAGLSAAGGPRIDALTRALPIPQRLVSAAPLFGWSRLSLYLAALLLLSIGAWFAFELLGYDPITRDHLRILAYTREIVAGPGDLTSDSIIIKQQLPLLQYMIYGALVELFGWDFPLVAVPFAFSIGLAAVVGYAAYRVVGSPWAAAVATLSLVALPIYLEEARTLPFYPAAIVLGYGGLTSAVLYLRNGRRLALFLAVVGLVGALYSYSIGVLFLPVPALYLIVKRDKTTIYRLSALFALVGALSMPFIVWHLSVGGIEGFFRQEIRWMTGKGYLLIRNIEFFGWGSTSSLEYIRKLPGIFYNAAGILIFPLALLAIYGIRAMPSWTWRVAALAAFAIPSMALIIKTPAIHPKYVYILLPAIILFAVYGLAALIGQLQARGSRPYLVPSAAFAIAILLALTNVGSVRAEVQNMNELVAEARKAELRQIAKLVNDDKAVLGTRAWALVPYLRNNRLLEPRFVPEEDFVTYLSWPDRKAVRQVLRKHDVGWILIRTPSNRWEVQYNAWLREVTGELPRHNRKLRSAGNAQFFVEAFKGNRYILYRVID